MTSTVLRDKQGRNQSMDFDLFFELKDLCFPTYKYKQGNCHNIVHYCSMILTQRGIKHKKIWCYAPARFVKYARESISKPDPNPHASMGNLLWGYHVALFFEDGPFSFIYDFVVDENMPISLDSWVAGMGLSQAKVEIVDAENYLFYSLKKKVANVDFKYFRYEDNCKDDLWLPKGLAINETAMEFLNEERSILEGFSDQSFDYKILIGNILNFECVFKDQSSNNRVTADFQARHIELIDKYRLIYFHNLNKWVDKVEYLDC
ncbi:hypothetical protein SAMN06298216_3990 [Spirosomataceae bacterium TFI 002]|nr:hypothetical protein SAMN06298216_3990 [Spirosomataceae bacterium TFI 002]